MRYLTITQGKKQKTATIMRIFPMWAIGLVYALINWQRCAMTLNCQQIKELIFLILTWMLKETDNTTMKDLYRRVITQRNLIGGWLVCDINYLWSQKDGWNQVHLDLVEGLRWRYICMVRIPLSCKKEKTYHCSSMILKYLLSWNFSILRTLPLQVRLRWKCLI